MAHVQDYISSKDQVHNIYVVTALPDNGENLAGFATTPDAVVVGMAYHVPQGEIPYSTSQQVTDQQTGLTLGYREWGSPELATSKRVIDVLYGKGVGNNAALIRIVDAP